MMVDARALRQGAIGLRARWAFLLAAVAATGCGNLTAGGATGEATVYVTGESLDAQPAPPTVATERVVRAPTRMDIPPGAALPGPIVSAVEGASDDAPEGELELEFGLALITDAGTLVPLTEEDVRVRVEFPGAAEVRATSRAVPAGRYAGLRVVFTEIEVEVDAGLVVDGVEIVGPVEVELETDSMVVQRPLDLVVEDGGEAQLLVDMNASAWLVGVDPLLRMVAGSLVSDALRVVQR